MGKAFEKQAKTIKDQGEKQIDALESLKPKEVKPKEVKLKETKPVEYGYYFLNGPDGITNSSKLDFNN